MSAVPGDVMREPPPDQDDNFPQSFWPWFALGVLLFCWIAEATMCDVRGF